VTLRPDLAQAQRNLADIYDKMGWAEAPLTQRANELNPTDPLAWLTAAVTFLRLHWPEEAPAPLREAVRPGPTLPETHRRHAKSTGP